MRPLCLNCKQRPRAIAYYRKEKIQYRRMCEYCIKLKRKLKPPVAKWKLDGYKKKPTCDRCGFRAKYSAQLLVYHVDGDMNNTKTRNLKTVCQNCVIDIERSNLPWKPGDLSPDL